MITITAFKWVPPFAQGNVRDLRVRWALEETGLPYTVRLIDASVQRDPAYRAQQPFGQVPILQEDDLTLFESGAIVLHLAERTQKLLPRAPDQRARAISWLFASLNSIEPFLMNLAEVDFFMRDEEAKKSRRPGVVSMIETRLEQLEIALGDSDYLVEEFSVADLIMSSVLRILRHTEILDAYPRLTAYKERCTSRPAFEKALADQCRAFAENEPRT